MKKILSLLVALSFLATMSVFALNETNTGPQHITTCYITGMGALTSGDCVVLQTTSPTYWGREVTGSTAVGIAPYGVVLDSVTAANASAGTWIRVQTHGYTGAANVVAPLGRSADATASVNQGLVTAGASGIGTGDVHHYNKFMLGADNATTGGVTVLEARSGIPTTAAGGTNSKGTAVRAFINW